MKVYIVELFEDIEYSEYCGVHGVYATKELAVEAVEKLDNYYDAYIMEHKVIKIRKEN